MVENARTILEAIIDGVGVLRNVYGAEGSAA
jgi:hypothetical protein